MIYLVSSQRNLFNSNKYKVISYLEAKVILEPLNLVQLDTETEGLDCFTKKLLTIQLGNKFNQVVFDWETIPEECKKWLKEYLESTNRTFIGWNLLFDLRFLYVNNIYPNNLWDGMLTEKLLWLGYPAGMREMSLKAAALNYLNFDLDKSVRGKIINVGLTEEVVVYAAGDVTHLEDIKIKQDEELDKQDLQKAIAFENEFLKCLAYIEICGVKLDVPRWKKKMANDLQKMQVAEEKLNQFVVDWSNKNPEISKDKNGKNKFVVVNLQGDLFTGFDSGPKCDINWGSSKQVIPFFELLGFDCNTFDKATKKKKKSVDAKIIKKQIDVSPIAPIYLEYQEARKVVTTYGQNWIDAINPKTGRIHPDYYQLGTDTARLSSGGGLSNVNIQNIPNDKETRACFIAEKGNLWVSADYMSQESRLIASVSEDKAMIELFEHDNGDVHSLVAKMSYPEIVGDTPIEEIKAKFPQQRQDAKGVEFAVNYGGDANTIANNKCIPLSEAKIIYENFMKAFPGIKKYQDYCRMAVMRDGYILLNPITKHKAHIYDWDELSKIQEKFNDSEFWQYYRDMKKEAPDCDTVQEVRHYFRRKSASEKQSINYRIQNRGAMCFKLSSIKLFNYLKKHNLLGVVKYCIPVHDELDLEAPESIAKEIGNVLVKCMVEGGKPFCPNVFLGADVEIGNHWIH